MRSSPGVCVARLLLFLFVRAFACLRCKVGDDGDAMMDEDGEEEEEEGERQAVEDTAKATFKGHSDAVYCVAVNPNTVSQVRAYVCACP